MARITEKVKLPSNGMIYGDNFPNEITIKNLTVDEESMLYSSNSDSAIDNILKSIIEEKIDIDRLITPDKHFLLVRARILTYGNIYPLELNCPNCGEIHYDFDLNDMEVNELDSDFEPITEITLPQSKSSVSFKIPTGYDLNDMEKSVRRKVNKFGINEGKANYIGGIAMNIVKIEGEQVIFDEAYKFVSELSGRDSSYLKNEINKIDVGYDTFVTVDCPKCGREIKFRLPMTGDFFRTKFDD